MTKERINYVISAEGKYVGYTVNMPFIVGQADSIDELENAMRVMLKAYARHLQDLLASDEPFEYKQVGGNTFLTS